MPIEHKIFCNKKQATKEIKDCQENCKKKCERYSMLIEFFNKNSPFVPKEKRETERLRAI